jgi:FixJ family two-component response regulator
MDRPTPPASTVFVVDDDASLREALKSLFGSVGLRVETFASAPEFLQAKLPEAPSCLVLDVRLPGLSGLDFQTELAKANINVPIIFITGHGDIPMTVRAMKAGAVEFLTKPFRDQEVLDAVQVGLERDRARREKDTMVSNLRGRYETLTPREQEVVALVTTGLMNKQIAAEIGVTEITVKVHRGNAMRKMGAKSLADLVKMVDALGIRRNR